MQKSHAHIHYSSNICAKFQTERLKTLRRVDYTILLPLTETQPQNFLSQKCRNFVKKYFLLAKSHMHIFNMLKASAQCFKSIA